MSFGDSIKYCFGNYANFNGRAARPQLWWFLFFYWLVELVANILDRAIFNSETYGVLSLIAGLIFIIPLLAVGSRRLHDTGKSGWLQLLILIPCLGFLIMLIFWAMPGTPSANSYGDSSV